MAEIPLIPTGDRLVGGASGNLNRASVAFNRLNGEWDQTAKDSLLVTLLNARPFSCKITKWTVFTSPVSNQNRWHYDGTEVRIDENDDDVAVETAKRTFEFDNSAENNGIYLINRNEINNTDTDGVQGNSVDNTDTATATITYQPVGGGTGGTPDNEPIVTVFPELGADGRIRYFFDYQNAVLPECI